jgi:hypothetical protein
LPIEQLFGGFNSTKAGTDRKGIMNSLGSYSSESSHHPRRIQKPKFPFSINDRETNWAGLTSESSKFKAIQN